MVNAGKNIAKFKKRASKTRPISSSNIIPRTRRAAAIKADAAIDASLAKTAKRRAYYEKRLAHKNSILASGGPSAWAAHVAERKAAYAERKKNAITRRQNYAMGTHTKRGVPRKTRMEGGSCLTAAALYGEDILKSPRGKKFYWRTSKSGKRYRRYCKY